ncbi:hypothetical protein JF544_02430 [Halobacillus kuroshimensis]|uniref:Uncharacterized protein n=1 Tax=Halobacillus kuroshimensis TaxID=302481 RepID=A0ABS3DRW1_9BACI|nr:MULTISPECIES: hypothetical protein [Halobacillus]MBN8234080.1 hypothetical protein [Halobacillus kuroshimensis]
MKTYGVLFALLLITHTMTLVNITIFDGQWNGIVLFLSSILFLIGAVFFGTEFKARRKMNT